MPRLEDMKVGVARVRAFLVVMSWVGTGQGVTICALTLLRSLLPTAIIIATGVLIDSVPDTVEMGFGSEAGQQTLWALAAVTSAFFASGIIAALAAYAARVVGSNYVIAVHDAVAGAGLAPSGIAALEDPEVAGEFAAIEEYDRAGVYRNAVLQLTEFVTQRLQGAAALVILAGFKWWAPLVMFVGWRLVNRSVAQWVESGIALGHLQGSTGLRRAQYYRSLAVEAQAAKDIRIFGLGNWIVDQYADLWHQAMAEIWRGRKTSMTGVVLSSTGLAAAHGIVVGALGLAALGGVITVGDLVIFGQAVLATVRVGPLGDFQWQAGRTLHGAQRVVELKTRLQDSPSQAPRNASATSTSEGPVAVQLEDVRFTYRSRTEPTLNGLNLSIPAGQSLAIVGENGAGKSTLIKLLCGFYETEAGRISIDGETNLLRARRRLGAIFQDFVHYELPLSANVGFGDLKLLHEPEELETALHDAGAVDLLSTLPAGWDTVLARGYDHGADLSGGQWQKVALARAFAAIRGGAGLLILDEPTANLDVRAESELFERWLDITKDLTTILVSHRLWSVRHADRIVVLADGCVTEDGTHEELLSLGGRYATMYALQAERFAEMDPASSGALNEEATTVA